jgi:hypothetical protein
MSTQKGILPMSGVSELRTGKRTDGTKSGRK